MLISFLCSLWCCMSLRVSFPFPGESIEDQVIGRLKDARRAEYCSIVQSEGRYNAQDKFYVAERVFKDLDDIDSLEVLKCFVETMNLTLDDAFGAEGETLLFPAVKFQQLESVKHLTSDDDCAKLRWVPIHFLCQPGSDRQ